MITKTMLNNWFIYHTLDEEQARRCALVGGAGLMLAMVILENTPESADQTAAIRKVREAVMTANLAIVCKGR